MPITQTELRLHLRPVRSWSTMSTGPGPFTTWIMSTVTNTVLCECGCDGGEVCPSRKAEAESPAEQERPDA